MSGSNATKSEPKPATSPGNGEGTPEQGPQQPVPAPTPVVPQNHGQTPAPAPAPNPNSTPDPNSVTPLTGLWDAEGYTCFKSNGTLHEVISITQTGTAFEGVKVVGDPCVPAGAHTFKGTLVQGVLTLQFNMSPTASSPTWGSGSAPGTYNPALIMINGDGFNGPKLQLKPHVQ